VLTLSPRRGDYLSPSRWRGLLFSLSLEGEGWGEGVAEQPTPSSTIFQQEFQRLFKKIGYTTFESRRGS